MEQDLSAEKKRLIYRAMHRGFKEADLIIGRFAEAHVPDMTAPQCAEFEALLEVPDQVLYGWIVGREPLSDPKWSGIIGQIQSFDVAGTLLK
ncbi:MAG: FAD assembly factor SdhE [Parvularcula sp.]